MEFLWSFSGVFVEFFLIVYGFPAKRLLVPYGRLHRFVNKASGLQPVAIKKGVLRAEAGGGKFRLRSGPVLRRVRAHAPSATGYDAECNGQSVRIVSS